jgi:hypothetical protein
MMTVFTPLYYNRQPHFNIDANDIHSQCPNTHSIFILCVLEHVYLHSNTISQQFFHFVSPEKQIELQQHSHHYFIADNYICTKLLQVSQI